MDNFYWGNFHLSNIHWVDYTILLFLVFSAGCLTLIHIRKTLKYGYLRAFIQPIDSFDKKLLKTSGTLFVIFALLLALRFSFNIQDITHLVNNLIYS